MIRTVGAAIGAVIVFLFFVLAIDHARTPGAVPDLTVSAGH
jgi:hypothetical protein